MTPAQIIQAVAVILGLLSGWAWAKSAMLQIRPHTKSGWLDRLLNRISRKPPTWNAIAAFLAAATAITQAIALLISFPR